MRQKRFYIYATTVCICASVCMS